MMSGLQRSGFPWFNRNQEDHDSILRNEVVDSDSIVVLEADELHPHHRKDVHIYRRRWYILFLFSVFAGFQAGIWNQWGPIAAAAEASYGWNEGIIALMPAWGCIMYIPSSMVWGWLMDVKGLRLTMILTMIFSVVGNAIRCIPAPLPGQSYILHTGQAIGAFAGVVSQSGAPVLSAVWFPVEERTTATAIAFNTNFLGMALSFVLGPFFVPDPKCNKTVDVNCSTRFNATNVSEMRAGIMLYMYVTAATAGVLLILFLVYFPSRPPSPPSLTASAPRVDYKKGALKLLVHAKFWLLVVPYAISGGVLTTWQAVLDVNMQAVGESQETAGWLGFAGALGAAVSGVVIAKFSDMFSRHMKWFLVIMYTIGTLSVLLFALTYSKILPFWNGSLYIGFVISSITVNGAVPLFYELICESTYPIAEGVTNSLATLFNNVAGLVFLLLPMVPHIGSVWMNWFMLGSLAICLPPLLLFREKYNRLDIDTEAVSETNINEQDEKTK